MSCPSCFCPSCQAERQRWLTPPVPQYVPSSPIYPNTAPTYPNTPPLLVCTLCGVRYTDTHYCYGNNQ